MSTPLKRTYRLHVRDITGAVTRGKHLVFTADELAREQKEILLLINPERYTTWGMTLDDTREQYFLTRHIVSVWFEPVTDEA